MNTNPLNHPPALLAQLDQADATAKADIDRHLALLAGEMTRVGTQQAVSTLVLTLKMLSERGDQLPENWLRVLYVSALARLLDPDA